MGWAWFFLQKKSKAWLSAKKAYSSEHSDTLNLDSTSAVAFCHVFGKDFLQYFSVFGNLSRQLHFQSYH